MLSKLRKVDCIKGKYAKQVKKGETKRSVRILEIIHTYIHLWFDACKVCGWF
jgi:hypothetical protein